MVPKSRVSRVIPGILGLLVVLTLTGCIGIWDNSSLYTVQPAVGSPESDLLKNYGAPSFAASVDNQKIYTYKIRNNMYIICFGLFNGRDMVVVCEDGKVKEIKSVERPKAFSLFQPWTWADTE